MQDEKRILGGLSRREFLYLSGLGTMGLAPAPRGIPTVAFGAGHRPESNIHGADENLSEKDFILATKTSAATLVTLLGLHS